MSEYTNENPGALPSLSNVKDGTVTKRLTMADISEEGQEWLRIALDPFADEQLKLTGKPTGSTLPTNVLCVTSTMSVTKPLSFQDADWGFHATLTPFFTEQQFYSVQLNGNSYAPPVPGTTLKAGAVNVQMYQSTLGDTWTAIPNPTLVKNISIADEYLTSSYRLIGAGMEIHDVSADLIAQGTVTTYSSPSQEEDGYYVQYVAEPLSMYDTYPVSMRVPPQTAKDAILLPGAVQRKMKTGAYLVQRDEDLERSFHIPHYKPLILLSEPGEGGQQALASPTGAITTSDPRLFNGHSWTGAYCEGLPSKGVYRIITRHYLELAPGSTDIPYITMANLAPQRNEEALQMYVDVIGRMPSSVPVSWNASGDWWRSLKDVLMAVAKPVTKVLSMTGIPVVSQIAGATNSYLSQIKQKKKAKQNGSNDNGGSGNPLAKTQVIKKSKLKND